MTDRKTPLFEAHRALGAKMAPFGGWNMPISYTGVLQEHAAVRTACGIFDVSHMGEVRIKGRDAEKFVQSLTINDVKRLGDGDGQYSAILKPDGGMIDDLIVYRLNAEDFFICVNASNVDKDFRWFAEHTKGCAVEANNESDQWSQLAVQGPKSPEVMAAVISASDQQKLLAMPYMKIAWFEVAGTKALIARTGYTGEHGYEIYLPNQSAVTTWNKLLATKDTLGTQPIGLGARDTLRLEACYLLYGNDMDETVNPLEAGIGWATRLDSDDFIGKTALVKQKAAGVPRQMVAFTFADAGVPRHGMQVYHRGQEIGTVTSGSVLPTVGGAGGMALVKNGEVKIGDEIEVDVRGKRKLARVAKRPLYSPKVKV